VQGPVISIIDDDASIRLAVERLLTSMGFAVHAFASANEFLGSPRLKDTFCIVADMEMPGMNGLELQEHLIAHVRTSRSFSSLPFPTSGSANGQWKAARSAS